jgi:hypothetical protein
MTKNEAVKLRVQDIIVDAGTQMRASNNEATIEEYAEALREREHFPPLSVVSDGTNYWLYDGFHRHAAGIKAGLVEMLCNVQAGTLEDACWHAIGANGVHGLPRTNADKRNAVLAALAHPASANMTTREVAKKCRVSHTFVRNIKLSQANVGDTAGILDDPFWLPQMQPDRSYYRMGRNNTQYCEIHPHPESPELIVIRVRHPDHERVTYRGLPRDLKRITSMLKDFDFEPDPADWFEDLSEPEHVDWLPNQRELWRKENAVAAYEEAHGTFPAFDDLTFWDALDKGEPSGL